MGIGNLSPIKEREQISSGTVQNASKRKEKMCAYLTSTTKVKARYKLRENTVQPHKMAQNYQCQMMKTQKNSTEELKRMKLGVNTPQNNKLTHKEQRR